MGNQQGSRSSGVVIEEALESMQKEKQRDDHLKNLDFKRTKSIRKSIAKRLKGGKKRRREKDQTDGPSSSAVSEIGESSTNVKGTSDVVSTQPAASSQPPSSSTTVPNSTSNNVTVKVFERDPERKAANQNHSSSSNTTNLKTKTEKIFRNDANRKPLVGEPQPLPTHVQDSFGVGDGSKSRSMDRLRRSLRSSLRKKKNKDQWTGSTTGSNDTHQPSNVGGNGRPLSEGSKPHQWQSDEISVRSGTCNFHVKYLGSVEVFDSRGMQVCEEAIKVLKNSKRKSVRCVLHVGGDGLKVVDDDTKGLIVDQTIEKVSFCAPDRNYERGFSYICRDGTTRRWMCHGFIAIKESGERLSHAVGCAFAVCLERKQKRDRDCTVSMNFDASSSSFTRVGSFRQATITERLQDPQVLKPGPKEPPVEKEKVVNPYAIARPHPTDLMLQRQTSFRGFGQLQSQANSPFKRQLSLRLTELPSTVARQKSSLNILAPSQDDQTSSFQEPPPLLPITERADSGNAQDAISSTKPDGVKSHLEELSMLTIEPPSSENMENEKLSAASIFINAGLTQFEPTPRQTTAFSTVGPRILPTVLENETATPPEEFSPQLASLPPITFESNFTGSTFATQHTDKQLEFDPFISLNHPTLNASSSNEKPASPSNIDILPIKIHIGSNNEVSDKSEHFKPAVPQTKLDPLSNVKPVVYDNPWDLVPDQPMINVLSASATLNNNQEDADDNATDAKVAGIDKSSHHQNISNCDSSSGISSSSATSLQRTANLLAGANSDDIVGDHQHYHQLWLDEIPNNATKVLDIQSENSECSKITSRDITAISGNGVTSHADKRPTENIFMNGSQYSVDPYNVNHKDTSLKTPDKNGGSEPKIDITATNLWSNVSAVVLDDPFDAEWAALATRESVTPSDGAEQSQHLTRESPSSTNPFAIAPPQLQNNTSSAIKAFELQM